VQRSTNKLEVSPLGRAGSLPRALFLFFVIGSLVLSAQNGVPSTATIKVDVNLVVLHVAVRARGGAFVTDLPRDAFHLFEDGKPQHIRLFESGDVPVTMGLIVDSSGSMRRKRHDVIAAALALVRASNPQDELFVVNFNDRVSLGLPANELFSAKIPELEESLSTAPATGRTALYDAVETGLAHLKKGTRDKKVLVVISDGGDNASHETLARVLQDAERSNVIIYTIGLLDQESADQRPGILKRMARITGGEAFFPGQTSQLVEICQAIAADIRHQYTIGYLSSNQNLDDTWRTIKVTVTPPHGEKLHVRTRDGYRASPPGQSSPSPENP